MSSTQIHSWLCCRKAKHITLQAYAVQVQGKAIRSHSSTQPIALEALALTLGLILRWFKFLVDSGIYAFDFGLTDSCRQIWCPNSFSSYQSCWGLRCLAAHPQWFATAGSCVLELVEVASKNTLSFKFKQTSHWILSQLACYGCPSLRGILAEELSVLASELRSMENAGAKQPYGSFVHDLVNFGRMIDKRWIVTLRHLLSERGPRRLFQEAMMEAEVMARYGVQPAVECPLLPLVLQLLLDRKKNKKLSDWCEELLPLLKTWVKLKGQGVLAHFVCHIFWFGVFSEFVIETACTQKAYSETRQRKWHETHTHFLTCPLVLDWCVFPQPSKVSEQMYSLRKHRFGLSTPWEIIACRCM